MPQGKHFQYRFMNGFTIRAVMLTFIGCISAIPDWCFILGAAMKGTSGQLRTTETALTHT